MSSYCYDIYIDDKLVAVVFEADLALAFIKMCLLQYENETHLRYSIRRREKGEAVEMNK